MALAITRIEGHVEGAMFNILMGVGYTKTGSLNEDSQEINTCFTCRSNMCSRFTAKTKARVNPLGYKRIMNNFIKSFTKSETGPTRYYLKI